MNEQSAGPREVFAALDRAIGGGRWHDLCGLYASDVVVSNPFAADGPTEAGRESVEEFFGFLASRVEYLRVEDAVVHATGDPEVIVAEFRFVGATSDAAFEIPAVFVLRVRGGLIVESRDYMGPQRPVSR